MDTEIRAIDIAAEQDLNKAIKNTCQIMAFAEYKLAGTFIYGTLLTMIFQRI